MFGSSKIFEDHLLSDLLVVWIEHRWRQSLDEYSSPALSPQDWWMFDTVIVSKTSAADPE
jgi:hypothetical protein